ncbi:hypothetical protein ACFQ0B_59955 [Nonomuraea thailandensis]
MIWARIVLWRLAFAVPLLLAVTFGMFALAKASPFDPVRQYLGERAMVTDPRIMAEIRANWGWTGPSWSSTRPGSATCSPATSASPARCGCPSPR